MTSAPQMPDRPLRILHSFPHRLGRERICTTAWHEINGVAVAGGRVHVIAGDLTRPFSGSVSVDTTFRRGSLRVPYRILGTRRMCRLHDWLVARRLPSLRSEIDLVHVWPLAAERTMRAARRLGLPTFLERPNAHTRYAYKVANDECRRLGLELPSNHEHAYNAKTLHREELEYSLADQLLCPSEFVASTFRSAGFPDSRIARHQYGYEEAVYRSDDRPPRSSPGLRVLFVGGCAPRKGLHFALQAWIASAACRQGTFHIAGQFVPGYAEMLAPQLAHPSVKALGHRKDVADLMRNSDVLVLPSIEEGSALVTYEARGCGCVLVVSDAAGAVCTHRENALVHRAGNVAELTSHLTQLHEDRALLERLQRNSLASVGELTWDAAGRKLLAAYRRFLDTQDGEHDLAISSRPDSDTPRASASC